MSVIKITFWNLKNQTLQVMIGNYLTKMQQFKFQGLQNNKTFTKKMCMCCPSFSHFLTLNQVSNKKLISSLPALTKQRQFMKLSQLHDLHHWKLTYLHAKPDIIFYNGTVYTMEESLPIAEAVSTLKNRIYDVGNSETLLKTKGPHTKLVDLKGRTLVPGFIDPHIHMVFSSMKRWTQLSPFSHKNTDEVYMTITDTVKNTEEGAWAQFQLYDPMITNGYLDVSRKQLDKLSQTKAIFILESNGHIAHVNSYALKLAGISEETPDPEHGRFIRDYNGQLTGEVQENGALQFFSKIFPKVSSEEYINNFQKLLSHASSKGCTTLHDCGIGLGGAQTDLAVLYEVFKHETPVRYSGYLISTSWDTWMKMKMKPEHQDIELRINGVKCWVDGSTQAGSAFLNDPYLKPEWGNGSPNYKQDALNKAVLEAHRHGFQVGIHANGDAAIDMAIKAFQNANKNNKKYELRHRIEHSTICHRDQLVKMKAQHLSPSFLIGHIYYYGQVFRDRILGTKRANLVDPMKSAIDCGLKPTLHSDYNCQPIDPLRCIYNAVTRIMRATKEVLNPDECVTAYQALQSMTINAAWQCHMDDIVGSLRKGKMADFVILEQDPTKVDPETIIDIKIWQTWKDGFKWYQG